MEQNLEKLAAEIENYLHAESFIVYPCLSRRVDDRNVVYWDHERSPDFRRFLECAQQMGVRLVHFNEERFDAGQRESALEMLEETEMTREERRQMERRIQAFAKHEGKLCSVELSFDFEGRTYMFAVETEWLGEWHSIVDELGLAEQSHGDEDEGYRGFYSNN